MVFLQQHMKDTTMRAIILLAPTDVRRNSYAAGMKDVCANAYFAGAYAEKHEVVMFLPDREGEGVAEEMFDLTNNPSRQDERELAYGRHRSVSVGDIVEVEDRDDPETVTAWLCMSSGWHRLM